MKSTQERGVGMNGCRAMSKSMSVGRGVLVEDVEWTPVRGGGGVGMEEGDPALAGLTEIGADEWAQGGAGERSGFAHPLMDDDDDAKKSGNDEDAEEPETADDAEDGDEEGFDDDDEFEDEDDEFPDDDDEDDDFDDEVDDDEDDEDF